MYTRYAVYYLPPKDSQLAEFGANWFGYDVRNGQFRDPLNPSEFSLESLTQIARRYGLHGTLKAPIRLKKKHNLDKFCAKVEKQANRSARFELPAMKITELAGFTSIMPKHHRAKLMHLEERLVTKLNKYGKKPDAQTRDKRRNVNLNALESEYLQDYGYPYVLDHFRFHLTLCDKAPKDKRQIVQKFLEQEFGDLLTAPLPMHEIAVVGERERDGFFEEIERFPLSELEAGSRLN